MTPHYAMRESERKTVTTAKPSEGTGESGPEETGPVAVKRQALDHLFSVTYEELRRLASSVRRGDPSATLSPTELAYSVRLKDPTSPEVLEQSRPDIKRIAARGMRPLLGQ